MAVYSNLLFDSILDALGGNPTMKKKSLAKLIKLKKSYDLCHIWRVRNMKSRQCTFTQQHSSAVTQHRLDFIFVSNTFQELVTTTEILTPDYRRNRSFSSNLLSLKRK